MGKVGASIRDINGIPKLSIRRMLDHPGKSLYTHDEYVGRHRVTLSDSSKEVELLRGSTIDKDLDRAGSDVGHDKFGEHFGDAKELKSIPNEIPF